MEEFTLLTLLRVKKYLKTKLKNKYRFAICLVLVVTVSLFAQNNSTTTSFADNLFEKGEFYRAITEYKRFLFDNAQTIEDSLYAFQQISKSYYFGEDYEKAIASISILSPVLNDNDGLSLDKYLALSYLKLGFPKSTILVLVNNANDPKSKLLLGTAYLSLNEWDSARNIFKSLDNNSDSDEDVAFLSKELISISKEGEAIRNKNPILSAILSAIIPGSGYVYTENYQTGVSSFLINSLLIGSSYELHKNGFKFTGSTATLISFGWYLGNIYGSFTSAIKNNKTEKGNFVNNSCSKYIEFIEND